MAAVKVNYHWILIPMHNNTEVFCAIISSHSRAYVSTEPNISFPEKIALVNCTVATLKVFKRC
jgi:hypothetical protein